MRDGVDRCGIGPVCLPFCLPGVVFQHIPWYLHTMLLADLDYDFPTELVATAPSRPTRVAYTAEGREPLELNLNQLLGCFDRQKDLMVVNETKVLPMRIFSAEEAEILFLRPISNARWEVLFPARAVPLGARLRLPGGVEAVLVKKGLPQEVVLSRPVSADYFSSYGEFALPPYIQEARAERHNRSEDRGWYQTDWAKDPGAVAAPTASLHFTESQLRDLGRVARLTLHVGAGTFFPVRTPDLRDHEMHAERVHIPDETWAEILRTRLNGGKVWAMGTTAARAIESGERLGTQGGERSGETRLFIFPPYQFQFVDVLLTNFHQPRSTLLALVAAFAGLATVKSTYNWAMARGFKLFSYGDLSAWTRGR